MTTERSCSKPSRAKNRLAASTSRTTSVMWSKCLTIVLVVADSAVLISHLGVEGVLLERLVRAGPRPPIGDLLDLAFGGVLHDLLPDRETLLADDFLQVFTLQI